MLINVDVVENLRSLARLKRRNYETKTVISALIEEAISNEWEIYRKNKKSVRLRRQKPYSFHFVDRIWSLLYQMNFTHLSGEKDTELALHPKKTDGRKMRIDVVGIDNEIAIAIKCKSSEEICR